MTTIESPRALVRQLTEVFRREGFDGASLTVLANETGLGRASLYHHFPGGKEEMARAVFARVSQDFTRAVLAPLAGSDPPAERLARMTAGLESVYDGGHSACLIDVFTLGGGHDLFAEDIGQAVGYWSEAIARVLTEAGLDSETAVERAEDAIIAVEGALVLARASGDLGPFRRTLAALPARLLAGTGLVAHSD